MIVIISTIDEFLKIFIFRMSSTVRVLSPALSPWEREIHALQLRCPREKEPSPERIPQFVRSFRALSPQPLSTSLSLSIVFAPRWPPARPRSTAPATFLNILSLLPLLQLTRACQQVERKRGSRHRHGNSSWLLRLLKWMQPRLQLLGSEATALIRSGPGGQGIACSG